MKENKDTRYIDTSKLIFGVPLPIPTKAVALAWKMINKINKK